MVGTNGPGRHSPSVCVTGGVGVAVRLAGTSVVPVEGRPWGWEEYEFPLSTYSGLCASRWPHPSSWAGNSPSNKLAQAASVGHT